MNRWFRLITALAVVAGAGVFGYLFSNLFSVGEPPLWYGLLHILGYVIALSLMPGIPYMIGGVLLFGPYWGSLFNLLGLSLGSTALAAVVRFGFRDTVLKWDRKGRMSQLDPNLRTVLRWRLFFLPHIPLNMVVGTGSLPLGQFLLVNLVSFIPSVILYAVIGGTLRDLARRHPYWTAGIFVASVAGFLAAGLFRRRWSRRKLAEQLENRDE